MGGIKGDTRNLDSSSYGLNTSPYMISGIGFRYLKRVPKNMGTTIGV